MAKVFGCTDRTVVNALSYGRKAGIFNRATERGILEELAYLSKTYESLEKQYKRQERRLNRQARGKSKDKKLYSVSTLLQISKTMLEYRGRIQELRGLYKQYVSIEHTAGDDLVSSIKDAYTRRRNETE